MNVTKNGKATVKGKNARGLCTMEGKDVYIDVAKLAKLAGLGDIIQKYNLNGNNIMLVNPNGLVVEDDAAAKIVTTAYRDTIGVNAGFSIDAYGFLKFDKSKQADGFKPISEVAQL